MKHSAYHNILSIPTAIILSLPPSRSNDPFRLSSYLSQDISLELPVNICDVLPIYGINLGITQSQHLQTMDPCCNEQEIWGAYFCNFWLIETSLHHDRGENVEEILQKTNKQKHSQNS